MGQLISKKAKKENEERVEIEISKKRERVLLNAINRKILQECVNHPYKNKRV